MNKNLNMQNTSNHNSFFIYIIKYLGIALIAGSVVHAGTLDNGFTRYIILGLIGLVFMILGNVLEAKQKNEKIDFSYLFIVTVLSFATGFLSGGIQHYLDDPAYAGMLLALGIFFSYIAYFIKEKFPLKYQNLFIVFVLALAFLFFSNYLDQRLFPEVKTTTTENTTTLADDGHNHTHGKPKAKQDESMMSMSMSDMIKSLEGKKGKELEKEFILGMIPHHQGAVDMAKILLADPSISQELQNFAKQIIEAQEDEIKTMNNWLE